MQYHAECKASSREPSIAEGIARVHPRIAEALQEHEHVCVETTGASREILDDLLSIQASQTLVARVAAPLDLCLQRIAARDQENQIPMDVEMIHKVYALSVAAPLQADLTLENTALSEADVVSAFEVALTTHFSRRPQAGAAE